ncbi:ABC transporter ATP-binding protein [Microbacterium saperdae]
MSSEILAINDLRVTFPGADGSDLVAVDGVSLSVRAGEVVGIAGESGSGKTLTALSALGLLPRGTRTQGTVLVDGADVLSLGRRELRDLRGGSVAMVFQDPMAALHPMLTVERQLTEHVRFHKGLNRRAARTRATELLEQVRIPDPSRTLRAYPHQFSGGMRQRIAIAMALACDPKLLMADEPTTALDVTVQAGVLRLLDQLRREEGLAVVVITHDLGVLSAIADRVLVMYAGRAVEVGTVGNVLGEPRHPYTTGLLAALPHPDRGESRPTPIAGIPPRLGQIPGGCAFHPRCPAAVAACSDTRPALISIGDDRGLACAVDPYRKDLAP